VTLTSKDGLTAAQVPIAPCATASAPRRASSRAAGRSIGEERVWTHPDPDRPDFRFVTVNSVDPALVHDIGTWENADTNFRMYLYQYVSGFDYARFDPGLKDLLSVLLPTNNARSHSGCWGASQRCPSAGNGRICC
jgi:hypothetical protein